MARRRRGLDTGMWQKSCPGTYVLQRSAKEEGDLWGLETMDVGERAKVEEIPRRGNTLVVTGSLKRSWRDTGRLHAARSKYSISTCHLPQLIQPSQQTFSPFRSTLLLLFHLGPLSDPYPASNKINVPPLPIRKFECLSQGTGAV